MDKQTRLEAARQTLRGAKALLKNEDFRGSVSRCYYAAYQAMWAALGDPEKKPRWEHLGIIKTFVRGKWFDDRDRTGEPGLFERQRFSLRRLYDLRLGADYRVDPITQEEAQWAIQVVQDVIGVCGQKESSHETKHEE